MQGRQSPCSLGIRPRCDCQVKVTRIFLHPRRFRSRFAGVPLVSSNFLLRQENFRLRENCSMATERTLASRKASQTVPTRPGFAPIPPKQSKNPNAFPRRILQKPNLSGIKSQPRRQNRNHPQTRQTMRPLCNSMERRRTRRLNRPCIAAATVATTRFASSSQNSKTRPHSRRSYCLEDLAVICSSDFFRIPQSKPQQNPTLVDIQSTANEDALLELRHG